MSRKSRVCECGSPKVVGAEACPRCAALDGTGVPEQTLVNALRSLGGEATSEAIMVETGWSYRHLRRTSAKLEQSGRVLRVETGEERHVNQPTLLLDEVMPLPAGWRQMQLPRLDAYLEATSFDDEEAAGSRRIIRSRRVVRRQRAHQMAFRFKKPRRVATDAERAAA